MSARTNSSNRWQPRLQPPPSPAGEGDSLLAVPTIADLIALDATLIDDGGAVNVKSVLAQWIIDKTSAAVVDGITIVAANPVGRWFRTDSAASVWLAQATWHINAITGDDENFGTTALTALQTHAELMRRIHGGIPVPDTVTVYLDSDFTEFFSIDWGSDGTSAIYYQGQRTVIYSGTVTGATAYNPAGGTPGQITDAAIPVSWTASALVGEHFVMTSGPNAGAVGVIAKDNGAKSARYSPMCQSLGFVATDPAVGETFDVYTLTEINGAIISGTTDAYFLDVNFVGPGAAPWGNFTLIQLGGSGVAMVGCTMTGGIWTNGNEMTWAWSTRFVPSWVIQLESSALILLSCEVEDWIEMNANRGIVSVELSSISQYTAATGAVGWGRVGGDRVQLLAAWGIFDNPGGTDCNYRVRIDDLHNCGAVVIKAPLWGTGNAANYGIRVQSGGTLIYSTLPTVGPNVVADTIIGTITRAYAALPATDLTRLCGIVPI